MTYLYKYDLISLTLETGQKAHKPNERTKPMDENQVTETSQEEMADLMTPEEIALFKKLQAKKKAMQQAMSGHKEKLFKNLTEDFGATISKAKKDVVTISTGEPLEDGNIYAITFGSDEQEDADLDSKALAESIIQKFLATIEPIMGTGNSVKVTGTYQDKKLFWQVRRRS